MLNFIVFIFCITVAIYDFYEDLIGFGLFQAALAFSNLPFAIKWLMTIF